MVEGAVQLMIFSLVRIWFIRKTAAESRRWQVETVPLFAPGWHASTPTTTERKLRVITIHHLGLSQSDRVVWLMEELNLPYKLKWYDRKDRLAPPEYLALHPRPPRR